ncbi:MAG: hypothetical protein GY851_03750 [bacterium]|nr:hypothetical protein [bacterium]
MTNLKRVSVAIVLVLTAWRTHGAEEPPAVVPVVPDLAALQETTLKLCADARGGVGGVERVEFVTIQREEYLLPGKELLWERPTYVVNVHERANWYKASAQHILVLEPDETGFKPAFQYIGGRCESGLGFTTRHFGTTYRFEGNAASSGYLKDLVVEDYSSGTGYSQKRLLIFHFDPDAGRFMNVFDELIALTGRDPDSLQYESDVEFRRTRHRHEIVITTNSFKGDRPHDDSYEGTEDHACLTRVYRWRDGRFRLDASHSDTSDPLPKGWMPGKWYTEFPIEQNDATKKN